MTLAVNKQIRELGLRTVAAKMVSTPAKDDVESWSALDEESSEHHHI